MQVTKVTCVVLRPQFQCGNQSISCLQDPAFFLEYAKKFNFLGTGGKAVQAVSTQLLLDIEETRL